MRKIVLFLAAFALILSSCNEKVSGPSEKYAEVSFSVDEADFVTLKAAPGKSGNVPECSDLSMDFAVIDVVNLGTFTSDIFYANGKYVTQPFKIMMEQADTKDIVVTKFCVYHGSADDMANAVLVKAAPDATSDYAELVDPTKALPLGVTVQKFAKVEAAVDVLCFEDLFYDNFGFTWFKLDLMTIKSLCFFGDVCTGKLEQYGNSDFYADQDGYKADNYDLVAIMKVTVSKQVGDDWIKIKDFTNEAWNGEGDCMTVYWGDYDEVPETFKIDLEVLLPSGNILTYQHQKTWIFDDTDYNTDDADLFPLAGEDGVVDFVIGNCAYEDPDYIFAPHQNIPTGNIQMTATAKQFSGTGFYWDLSFTDMHGKSLVGYDFDSSGGWCGDKHHTLTNGTKTVKAYCSYTLGGTLGNLDQIKLDKVNWIANNITRVIPDFDHLAPTKDGVRYGEILQELIWYASDGIAVSSTEATNLLALMPTIDADNRYIPKPGEWAAIILAGDGVVDLELKWNQILFTIVDP